MKRAAVALAVLGLALAGCNDTSSETAQPTTTKPDIFNVCRDPGLSDAALLAAGLDPTTKRVTVDPPEGPSTFRICSWRPVDDRYAPTNYTIGVFSTSRTLDQLTTKEGVTVLRESTVNGRRALFTSERNDPGCWLSMKAEQGMFTVDARQLSQYGDQISDLCDLVTKHAEALEPSLPK
ncbi:DUF3558 domain-containing protein [Nocardia rhizosphaerae]|uniref:DUF3558 domain-containing protein n=1 Tax=Nocardia rhizosphaerae TaxID=1691571 RepID=A0ABV8L994_9NOCA